MNRRFCLMVLILFIKLLDLQIQADERPLAILNIDQYSNWNLRNAYKEHITKRLQEEYDHAYLDYCYAKAISKNDSVNDIIKQADEIFEIWKKSNLHLIINEIRKRKNLHQYSRNDDNIVKIISDGYPLVDRCNSTKNENERGKQEFLILLADIHFRKKLVHKSQADLEEESVAIEQEKKEYIDKKEKEYIDKRGRKYNPKYFDRNFSEFLLIRKEAVKIAQKKKHFKQKMIKLGALQ